ncbi:MAG: ribonuclease Z [Clostridia bacterium]|nr:ribonuclease Z [Clostridia bacterium]
MKIIACIEERNGMSFNLRRVSSDKKVIERIWKLLKGGSLWLSEYSAPLFKDTALQLKTDSAFLSKAQYEDYCFVENTDVTPYIAKCSGLILFKWNKKYPSDLKFPTESVVSGKIMKFSEEFSGTSHDKITMEVYE